MEREEWNRRYKQQIINRTRLSDARAQSCVDAVEDQIREECADDPEGAADEEMSYWED